MWFEPLRQCRTPQLCWAAILLPPALGLLLIENQYGIAVLGSLALGLAASQNRRFTYTLFSICLSVLALLTAAEWLVSAKTWTRPGESVMATAARSDDVSLIGIIGGVWDQNLGVRQWWHHHRSEEEQLSLAIGLVSGDPGGSWARSDARITYQTSNGINKTLVTFPASGDPYLWQRAYLPDGIAGRTFRATVTLQTIQSGPMSERSTRGLWLREGNGSRRWVAKHIPSDSDQRVHSLDWAVPADSSANELQIILNDFDGSTIEVSSIRLEEIDAVGSARTISPLDPNGVYLTATTVSLDGSRESVRGPTLRPTTTPAQYVLPISITKTKLPHLTTVALHVEPGLVIHTGQVRLTGIAVPAMKSGRQSLGVGHPNLLGHSLAILFASWIGSTAVIGLAAPFVHLLIASSMVAIWLSGSHSALIAAALAFLLACKLRPWDLRHWMMIAGVGAIVTILLLFTTASDVTGNVDARLAIWREAVTYLADPGLRLALDLLPAAGHAHNLILEFGVRHGMAGVVVAGWLLTGILIGSWLLGGWRGIAIGMPLVLLQLVDYTLFFTGVLYPALVALIALPRPQRYPG